MNNYISPIVVRIKRHNGKIVQGCDVYIGRSCNQGGWSLPNSKWNNPYSVKTFGRQECLLMYENYVRNNSALVSSLHELSGKVLGCWCKPENCHGDVLVKLFNEYFGLR